MSLFLAKPQRFLVRPGPGWLDVALAEVQEILESPLQKYKFAPTAAAEDGLIVVSECDYRQALELVCRVSTAHDVEWVIQSGRVQSRGDWKPFFEKSNVAALWADSHLFDFRLSVVASHPVVGTEREIKELAKSVWPFCQDDETITDDPAQKRPLQRIRVESSKNRHRILVSMGGEPLYKRGYKLMGQVATAPLPEHHASACFLWACSVIPGHSLNDLRRQGCKFVVPFAGTGTTGFEGVARLMGLAPALTRDYFGCESFSFHPGSTMSVIRQRLAKSVSTEHGSHALVFGEINENVALQLAEQVRQFVSLTRLDIPMRVDVNDFLRSPTDLMKDTKSDGFLFLPLNPPYGNRLAKASGGEAIYKKLGRALHECASSGNIIGYVICPDELTWKELLGGLSSFETHIRHFTHGGVDMRLVAFWSR